MGRGFYGARGESLELFGLGEDQFVAVGLFQVVLREAEGEGECLALFVHCLDAGEELGIQADVVAVFREFGHHLFGNGFQFVTGLGAHQVEENGGDALQQFAGFGQRQNGVGKGGRFGVGYDGRDFFVFLTHPFADGRFVMLQPDEMKRYGLMRGSVWL